MAVEHSIMYFDFGRIVLCSALWNRLVICFVDVDNSALCLSLVLFSIIESKLANGIVVILIDLLYNVC